LEDSNNSIIFTEHLKPFIMKIINTFMVCRFTNPVFKIPKFMKVHEIEVGNPDSFRTGFILDDRGDMSVISISHFFELKENMKELGL
jgi:hypothetical protein